MINKFLSSIALIFIVWFSLEAYLQPNDPIFLLKSSSMIVNSVLLLLAVGGIILSFVAYKLFWQAYLIVLLTAISLGFFVMLSLIDTHASYRWPFGLWDYFLLLQIGVTYAIGALDIDHQPVPTLHLPRVQANYLVNKLSDLMAASLYTRITKTTGLQKD